MDRWPTVEDRFERCTVADGVQQASLRQGDIVQLSMVLGPTHITTTQRYLHLLTEDLSASHQKVSILNRLA